MSEDPPVIESKFELGFLGMTPGVKAEVSIRDIITAVRRHAQCDWGDVDEEDAKANEWSLKNDARLLSVYQSSTRVKFYVITEGQQPEKDGT